MFIVGSGLSTLETSANPYIAVCGPPRWSEFRLELSQSFQAVGSVVAPVLASYVIFKNVGTDGKDLSSVQWVYLGIAIFVAALAVVFYFAPVGLVAKLTLGLSTLISHRFPKLQTPIWPIRPR